MGCPLRWRAFSQYFDKRSYSPFTLVLSHHKPICRRIAKVYHFLFSGDVQHLNIATRSSRVRYHGPASARRYPTHNTPNCEVVAVLRIFNSFRRGTDPVGRKRET